MIGEVNASRERLPVDRDSGIREREQRHDHVARPGMEELLQPLVRGDRELHARCAPSGQAPASAARGTARNRSVARSRSGRDAGDGEREQAHREADHDRVDPGLRERDPGGHAERRVDDAACGRRADREPRSRGRRPRPRPAARARARRSRVHGRDHDQRDDVVDDETVSMKARSRVREARADERQHAERERRVGRHRRPPAVRRRPPGVDGEVDQRPGRPSRRAPAAAAGRTGAARAARPCRTPAAPRARPRRRRTSSARCSASSEGRARARGRRSGSRASSCQTRSYDAASTFTQTSAATAAASRNAALPVSVRRKLRSGVSRFRAQAVRPENGDSRAIVPVSLRPRVYAAPVGSRRGRWPRRDERRDQRRRADGLSVSPRRRRGRAPGRARGGRARPAAGRARGSPPALAASPRRAAAAPHLLLSSLLHFSAPRAVKRNHRPHAPARRVGDAQTCLPEVTNARQGGTREEREAVRGAQGQGNVQGTRREDRELAWFVEPRRQDVAQLLEPVASPRSEASRREPAPLDRGGGG